MKKLPLAFAVLAAVSGMAAAQTNVTIYGLIDGGIEHQTGGANGSVTKLTSGVQNASRIGFKGTEDLGGGLSALFTLENGFALDDGSIKSGGLFGRQAFVGLQGGFGAVTLGRQYTPIFTSLCGAIDPFACGLAGNAANLMSQGGAAATGTGPRTNNAIKYVSPAFSGVQAEITYGFGETAGDNSAKRAVSGALGYGTGPLVLRLAYHKVNDDVNATNGGRETLLGAKYDFGMAAVHVAYAINKGVTVGGSNVVQADTRDTLVGVSVPFGASTFLASYIQKKDKTAAANDAKQYALGYTYALSKRTNLYTSYAHINNTVANNAAGFYTAGNATDAGTGTSSYNVGVRHTF